MAKLTPDKADELNTAAEEGGEYGVIPEGVYHARLNSVDASREGPNGPYWTWEYDIVGEEYDGRKLWNNTSLSAKAAWKFKETFDAFGVPLDTDTDDLCGKIVKLVVSVRVIQAGNRKGQEGNQVDTVLPADEDFSVPSGSGTGATAPPQGADDIF